MNRPYRFICKEHTSEEPLAQIVRRNPDETRPRPNYEADLPCHLPILSDIGHFQPASRNDLASQHIPRRRRLQLVALRCFESLPVSTRLLQIVQARWSKTPLPPSTLLSSPSSTTPRSGVSKRVARRQKADHDVEGLSADAYGVARDGCA